MKPIKTPQIFKRDMYLSLMSESTDYDDNGMPLDSYLEPLPFLNRNGVNYQPLTSESDIQRYGASSIDVVKAVIMNTDLAYNHFNPDMVGSLVYLFGASPYNKPKWDKSLDDVEGKHGYWSNYEVDAVMPMLVHTNVFFKKKKRTGAS